MPTIDEDLETLRSYMRQGLIVEISGDYPFPTPHSHRFVILNANPDDETLIVAPHATHQVEKEINKAYIRDEDPLTIAVIAPNKYRFFPKETAFNCNELEPMTLERLAESLNEGNLRINFHELLDPEDLQKIIEGALASKQTSQVIASLITGE